MTITYSDRMRNPADGEITVYLDNNKQVCCSYLLGSIVDGAANCMGTQSCVRRLTMTAVEVWENLGTLTSRTSCPPHPEISVLTLYSYSILVDILYIRVVFWACFKFYKNRPNFFHKIRLRNFLQFQKVFIANNNRHNLDMSYSLRY